MSVAASALIDGRGATKIALAILEEIHAKKGAKVQLRLAAANDEHWLLKIQQHPQTRRHFRNPAIPTAEDHQEWMRRVLTDPGRLLLAIIADDNPVGSIRLDRLPDDGGSVRYEVAIAIDPRYYSQGIGTAALRMVRTLMPGAVLDAMVLPDNKPSQSLFVGAGFAAVSGNVYRNEPRQALS